MNKQTLWKRIFGQKSTKKAKAQQAFQEQFDTKLRFRELEPRVVLAAAALDGSDNLAITINDGDTVEIARDGGTGNLTITGLTEYNAGVVNDTDVIDLGKLTINSVTVDAGTDAVNASELFFADSLGDMTNSFTTADVSINGIDLVDIGNNLAVGDNIKIGGDLSLSNTGNMDNSSVGNDGSAVLEGSNLVLNEVTGDLDVNLDDSEHKFTTVSGTASSVLFKDADTIELGGLVADSLEITAGGIISDAIAVDKIEVSGLASFTGNEVDLDNTKSAGHDFTTLTLNSTGATNILEVNGFDFHGSSVIKGALTVDTNGAIGQTVGSSLRTDSTADFTVADMAAIDLALTNNLFEGTVSVTGQSGRAGAITLNDSNGGFQFESVLATTLDVTSTGSITQTTDGIDVLSTAVFTTIGPNSIILASTNNAFGGNVSATGNGGLAAGVIIVDSLGLLILDDIQAASLNATAINGGIGQTATGLEVSGTSSFTVAKGQNIDLDVSGGNKFGGAVSAQGATGATGTIFLADSDADLTLGAINASAMLATSAGNIGQTTAGVQISGAATFVSANNQNIDLDDSTANKFGQVSALGAAMTRSNTVSIADSDGSLILHDINAVTLVVSTAGVLSQTSLGIDVSGTSTFVSGNGQTIGLNGSTSNLFGTVNAKGASGAAGNVFIEDSNGSLVLGEINAANLNAKSATSIDQTAQGVKVSNTATFTVGNFAGLYLNGSTSNQFGTVNISGATDIAGIIFIDDSDGGLILGDIAAMSLDAKATTFIDQTAAGVRLTNTGTFVSGNGQTIDLNNSSNNKFTAVNANGLSGAAGNVFISDSDNGLVLREIHATNLEVDAAASILQTSEGVKVSNTATFTVGNGQTIDLNGSTGNEFGTVHAAGASGAAGDIFLTDSDASLILGAINAANLEASAQTFLDQTAAGVVVSGTATFTSGNGQTIDLNNSSDNQFFTVNAKGASGAAGNVFIEDSVDGLVLGEINATNLNAKAATFIDQTAQAVKVSSTATFTTGNGFVIDLNNSTDNEFGTVHAAGATGAAGIVFIDDSDGDLTLGAIDAANLNAKAADRILQTTDGVKVSGTTTLTSGNGSDIDLDDSTMNQFATVSAKASSGTAGVFALNNSTGNLKLDDIQVTTLVVNTAGEITQTSTGVSVGGTTSLTAGNSDNVTLTSTANTFVSAVSVKGQTGEAGHVNILQSTGDLILGDIVAEQLTAENGAGADITDTSTTSLQVSGLTTLTANNVLLDTSAAGHQFDQLTLDTDGNANIVEQDGFSFMGTNIIDGNLDVNVGGTIDQPSGSLTVMGTTNVTTTGSISLNQSGNDFQSNITLSGTDVAIVDANEIKLGDVTADSFDVRALMGKIYQDSGTALDIAGTTLAKTTDNFDVLFDQAGNDFTGVVSVLGFSMPANVVLMDVNDLIIGDIESETLTATAGMSITQAMGTSIETTTSVSLVAGTTITLRDVTTPMLELTADGAIDQESGTSVIVSGMTTMEVPMGANVNLSETDNEFGSISVNAMLMDYAGTVTIYDSTGDLELKDIWADVLDVTVENGAISQAMGTAVRTSSSISLDVAGTMVLSDMTTPMLDLTAGGAISQEAGTSLQVSGMTTIEVPMAENVDLSEVGNEFGSISVNATSMVYAGTVTIYDGGNDDADAIADTVDDGLTLKDIYAETLIVTTAGTEGDIDQLMGTSLDVTGMTMVEVETGVDVDLSSTTNKLGSVSVNAISMVSTGTVTIYDSGNDDADAMVDTADDGLTLNDIYADTLIVTTTGVEGHVDQESGTALRVPGMTMVEVETGVDVDLSSTANKLGSVSVNAISMVSAGTVTITDSGNDDADATVDTWDDGLTLKDIWTDTLIVTTTGAEGHIDQAAGTALRVPGMTMVEVDTGVDVDLSSTTNKLGSISVNAISMLSAGTVTITDSGNDDADATVETWDDGLTLKDIWTDTLIVTTTGVEGHIDQAAGTALRVPGMTMVEVDAGVNVGLSSTTNKLGSISVNAISMLSAGTVAITDSGNDDADAIVETWDDGLTLKDIWTDTLIVTTTGVEGHIDQDAGTALRVPGMTMVEVETGVNVDLSSTTNKLGSVSVNASNALAVPGSEIYAGTVTIYDNENDNADALVDTWDDGITLKDIWADTLIVTTDGVAGHIDQQSGTKITTSKLVELNASGKIVLGDIVTADLDAEAELEVDAEAGTTVDASGAVSLISNSSFVRVSNIIADTLEVKAAGDISQLPDSLLTIDTKTSLILTAEGSVTLLNDGDNEACEDLDPADGNDLSDVVTVGLDDITYLKNFEILNINTGASVPTTMDFLDAINNPVASVENLTLKFTQAPLVTLPAINILGDLWIESGDDIKQSGAITVANDATFIGQQIHLADADKMNLNVSGHAMFIANTGDIEVGVSPSVLVNSIDRGGDSDAIVNLQSVTFAAIQGHVTINQDDQMTLVNGDICDSPVFNYAQSAVLVSSGAGIETGSHANLIVDDLTALKAASDIVLGASNTSDVDLRIVYIEADANVSIFEQRDNLPQSNDNGLAIVDGTKVAGTLAIQADGHVVQVNEFRTGAMKIDTVSASDGLFVTENGGVVLTSADFDTLAVSTDRTPLFVTPGAELDFATAGISQADGFGGMLITDTIDAFLPDDNNDTFAKEARADAFAAGAGENYSIVIVDVDDLTIGNVADAVSGGSVTAVDGIRTNGAEAGHVFVRTEGGDLTFGTDPGLVVGLSNSGVITALASGDLAITNGSWLHVTAGDDPVASAFAVVSTLEVFTDNPANDYEISNTNNPTPNEGPAYSRIPGNVNTYVLEAQVGKDSVATIVLDQLGVPGELDFEVTLFFEDEFGNSKTDEQEIAFEESLGADTVIEHVIPWEIATMKASLEGNLKAYNSSQINLFGNVANETDFNNLNVVVDQFEVFFYTVPDYVPEMTNFQAPNNPYVAPFIIPEAAPTPYASLTEITDDTRVATQIDGVTVVEVDPSDLMEIGEEFELDDDFMTLDAVKEFIQNGVQFPVGLYKIEILYPGAEVPEEYFYWKQDRLDPFDLFSHSTKPVTPQTADLAVADQAPAQLSAEEVWAREYDKWFPASSDLQPEDGLGKPAAEGEPGEMIPSEDDVLLERVSTVSLQEIDRMTDRLRAKRSFVRDSLHGAMIGGAALMAAVAAQGRRDEERPDHHQDAPGEQPEDSLDDTSLSRLRRRVRQWL
ncbi:beta strand repeat-containing protein [Bremerella alba]|uniref:Uncharacterized protein n=1 Tax=Bremerella alba TaxID=980252 RepID=A0A7V8V7B6_9BACT|nr:hypothetical protein [Bremerella alba]MBA2116218.1 hypothetical protein [Bremerella alba]